MYKVASWNRKFPGWQYLKSYWKEHTVYQHIVKLQSSNKVWEAVL